MNVISEVLKIEDEQTLRQLNTVIVSKLNNMRANKTLNAMSKFRVGNKVEFQSKQGRTLQGRVTKINQKTINVDTPAGEWRVAPTFLTVIG